MVEFIRVVVRLILLRAATKDREKCREECIVLLDNFTVASMREGTGRSAR